MASKVDELESRITDLEKQITQLMKKIKKSTRKARLFTDEQKAAIRVRLLAGQEAARKKREAGAKSAKKANNYIKTVEAVKPTEN